ncbi:MAG TPA: GTPase Era [Limnochordia bacterium]|nr:GTPase Era [Limnochordia bacterium]
MPKDINLSTTTYRSGFVAVVGRPNVGKSTLLNALLGHKVAIVSNKPQTTRNAIQCVLSLEGAQIVFLDTPGLHKPLHKLGEYMVKSTFRALEDVDLVLWLVEMGSWTAVEEHILGELAGVDHPVILVANKQDQLAADRQQVFLQEVSTKREFAEVLGVSALQGTGLDTLVDSIVQRLEEGPQYYPEDWITDHPERFVIAEFIREELLTRTEEEIPHSIAVDVDEIKEDPKKNLMRIRATIYVERESQKGIVIGKEGKMLKEVGTGARLQIEGLLGIRVYLDLWVKVKKDWRNKPGALREFGYE